MRPIKILNKLATNTQYLIDKLSTSESLDPSEAEVLMSYALEGNLSKKTILSWLRLSNERTYAVEEIVAYAKVMMAKGKKISVEVDFMDTCGTGGDDSALMNISTLVGLTLASLSIPVAKHGNRSISSKSGSADLLEVLGYPLNEPPEETSRRIKNNYFGFMFAPYYHPTMKYVTPARKELGVKTIFNILGPLCNPASAKVQLLGVYSRSILDLMVESLRKLGVIHALVISSEDHLDEVSPLAKTEYRLLQNQNIISGWILPPKDIHIASLDEVRIIDPEDSYCKARDTLQGVFMPGVEILTINVVVGLFLWRLHQGELDSVDLQSFIDRYFDEIKVHIQSGKVWRSINLWNLR